MGYTHYWERRPVLPARKFRAAADDCRTVYELLHRFPVGKVQWEYDDPSPPAFGGSLIRFNGVGEEDCGETFLVERVERPESFQRPRRGNFVASFCKTRRAPYDVLVCACLVILKHHFGDDFRISSDGDDNEEGWPKARAVCQEVLGYGKDFSLTTPDRLSPQGLWFSKPTDHPTYGRLWELENGWWVQKTTSFRGWPLRGGCFIRDSNGPNGDILARRHGGIREVAWQATKLYLQQLVGADLDEIGRKLLKTAMEVPRCDWLPWHVLADQREECGNTLLRNVLPKASELSGRPTLREKG